MAAEKKVRFGGFISEEEHERFRRNFPQYGATQWLIETCVKRFNDLVEKAPGMIDNLDLAIKSMLEANRDDRSDTVRSLNTTGTSGENPQ